MASRVWRETITTQSGSQVDVRGIDDPVGLVRVLFATGESIVVDPFDYLAPTEVRVDGVNDLLFVKAHGGSVRGGEQTWLFKCDLRRRELVQKLQVDASVLPDCR